MNRQTGIISVALAVGFGSLYFSQLATVPFHPDESTYIYMSRDFERVWQDPAALGWTTAQPLTAEVLIRLRDAPLIRYGLGLSLWLQGYPPDTRNTDWEWDKTWAENVAAGHLPRPEILRAARLPITLLSVLALVLLFWIGGEVGGAGVGLVAALLMGLHPLMLLHGRHAMAEGLLLFFSLLAVWGLLRLSRQLAQAAQANPPPGKQKIFVLLGWAGLTGLLIGLAVASKQNALALLPAALGASLWPLFGPEGPLPQRVRLAYLALGGGLLLISCALVFYALNPILYRQPLPALRAMLAERVDLMQRQTATATALFPQILTPTPRDRLRAAVLEVYLRPPAVWDIPMYVDQLTPQAEAYFAFPLHRPPFQPLIGAGLAGLGVAGAAISARRWLSNRLRHKNPENLPAEQTLWWWTAATGGMLLLSTPFDWQRYFMPLIPLACLWASLGLSALAQPLRRWKPRRSPRSQKLGL